MSVVYCALLRTFAYKYKTFLKTVRLELLYRTKELTMAKHN